MKYDLSNEAQKETSAMPFNDRLRMHYARLSIEQLENCIQVVKLEATKRTPTTKKCWTEIISIMEEVLSEKKGKE